jgi:membrane fusion protein, macrolide-specific efflux system
MIIRNIKMVFWQTERRSLTLIVIVAVLFLSGILLTACSFDHGVPVLATASDFNTDSSFSFQSRTAGNGKVVSNRVAVLSFPISGQITEILVLNGDRVQAGDVLARLDPTVYEFDVRDAESNLKISQSRYDKVIAGTPQQLLAEAEAQLESLRIIDGFSALTTPQDVAAAESRLEYLRAQPFPEDVQLAEGELEHARIDLEVAQTRLGWTELKAPFDGTITGVYRNFYENIQAGNQIIQLSDLTDVSVEVLMDEYQILDLQVEDPVVSVFSAYRDTEISGSVQSIVANEEDTPPGGFIVTVSLDSVPEWVRVGMNVEVVFPSN